jgi:hypothetical protein
MCVVAEVDGQVCGFANCVVHENTWETQAVCYLEDLYVTPSAPRSRRRQLAAGVAAQRDAGRGLGPPLLDDQGRHAQARRLYDRFAQADDFVRYVIRQR